MQGRALLGRRRSAKTDRLGARRLARVRAKEVLPESWIAPEEIQQLRDRTRLRVRLAGDRRRWALCLHAFLAHGGWSCAKERLLTVEGLRWAAGLELPEHGRLQVGDRIASCQTRDLVGATEAVRVADLGEQMAGEDGPSP